MEINKRENIKRIWSNILKYNLDDKNSLQDAKEYFFKDLIESEISKNVNKNFNVLKKKKNLMIQTKKKPKII